MSEILLHEMTWINLINEVCEVTQKYTIWFNLYKIQKSPYKLWYKKLGLCLSLGEGVWELNWELAQKDV